jgi:hypothetical protein
MWKAANAISRSGGLASGANRLVFNGTEAALATASASVWAPTALRAGAGLRAADFLLRAITKTDRARRDARADMVDEDLSELSAHDPQFYNAPNKNSLDTLAPAQGYSLRSRTTGRVLKYGETTRGARRYSEAYLVRINARMQFEASGSKLEMHKWQHEKILNHKALYGRRPRLNRSDW